MKLSICIPVYNVAPYVEQCARSLFEQTYTDIEYVFVDDCSSDDSLAIVQRVLRDYPARGCQVKFLRHAANRGLVAARKTAIRAATGDLLTHCDGDDWVDVDLYEKMIGRLVEKGADAVLCSVQREYENHSDVRLCPDALMLTGREALGKCTDVPYVCSAACTKIIKRALVDLDGVEYPEDICIGEDVCHIAQLLPSIGRFTSVQRAFYHYRISAGSMTHDKNVGRIVRDHCRIYDILARRVPGPEGVPLRRYLARMVLFWGTAHGILTRTEYSRWRETYESLGGTSDFTDRTLWGQRMMRLADIWYPLARLTAPLVRSHVNDLL